MYRDSGKLRSFKKYGKFMDPKMGTYFIVPGLARSYWSEKPNFLREICKQRKLGYKTRLFSF